MPERQGAKYYSQATQVLSHIQKLPVDEAFPPNPLTPYDINKLASEYLLKVYSQVYGLRTVTVRFASIYGPRQRVNVKLGWKPVTPGFATTLLEGEAPTIDGDGSQTRDFLYVKDAVDGVIRAMESSQPEANRGEVFILGTNTETSINELYSTISSLVGKSINLKSRPRKPEEIARMRYDYSKAQSIFSFKPKTPVAEGLKITVEFIKKEWLEEEITHE